MLRIKDVIKEKGLTVKEVAEKMSIQPPSLSRAINENTTVETLERIASALKIPIAELFEKPSTDIINCPYCGGKIKISKE